MINVFKDKASCCGCGLCFKICPKQAIVMKADVKGFFYPYINSVKCIDCKLCAILCPFNFKTSLLKNTNEYFGCKIKSKADLDNSRSGGIFTAISNCFLENSGVVYGASLDNDRIVRHHRATTKPERNSFRGSKYVSSNIFYVYQLIAKDLSLNKPVLFSGTGCQVEAIKRYLLFKKIDISNLYLLDIVCDGVGSPTLFQNYCNWIEKKYDKKISNFNFRDKNKFGWAPCIQSITFSDNKKKYTNTYSNLCFDYGIRESCFNCPFATVNRNSDFTIGDFWGIEKLQPIKFYEKDGCSLLILHSEKAKLLFSKIKDNLIWFKANEKDVLQPRLVSPNKRPTFYDDFWNLEQHSFSKLIKKYDKPSLTIEKLKRLLFKMKRIVKRFMRK